MPEYSHIAKIFKEKRWWTIKFLSINTLHHLKVPQRSCTIYPGQKNHSWGKIKNCQLPYKSQLLRELMASYQFPSFFSSFLPSIFFLQKQSVKDNSDYELSRLACGFFYAILFLKAAISMQIPKKLLFFLDVPLVFKLGITPVTSERDFFFHELAFLQLCHQKSEDTANFPNLFQTRNKWFK